MLLNGGGNTLKQNLRAAPLIQTKRTETLLTINYFLVHDCYRQQARGFTIVCQSQAECRRIELFM